MCSTWRLVAASFAVGAIALGTIVLSIATNNWLITKEITKVTLDDIDGFGDNASMFLVNETFVRPVTVITDIGLWRFCVRNEIMGSSCISLEYMNGFNKVKNEKQQTSPAIAESQKSATLVFMISLVMVLTATVFMVLGYLQNDKKTVIAGIIYINAGLCIAVGIVLYITLVNDEARSAYLENKGSFKYYYGWSAYLIGISFIASEVTAVFCITVYLNRHSKTEDMVKIIPGLEKQIGIEDIPCKTKSNPTLII